MKKFLILILCINFTLPNTNSNSTNTIYKDNLSEKEKKHVIDQILIDYEKLTSEKKTKKIVKKKKVTKTKKSIKKKVIKPKKTKKKKVVRRKKSKKIIKKKIIGNFITVNSFLKTPKLNNLYKNTKLLITCQLTASSLIKKVSYDFYVKKITKRKIYDYTNVFSFPESLIINSKSQIQFYLMRTLKSGKVKLSTGTYILFVNIKGYNKYNKIISKKTVYYGLNSKFLNKNDFIYIK